MAQGTTDHLLAQKLRAERAYAEDVRNGARVPAIGQHGERNDVAGRSAKSAFYTIGVHHFE
jgi:U3 small nucleolar ribonucleoprotein component